MCNFNEVLGQHTRHEKRYQTKSELITRFSKDRMGDCCSTVYHGGCQVQYTKWHAKKLFSW